MTRPPHRSLKFRRPLRRVTIFSERGGGAGAHRAPWRYAVCALASDFVRGSGSADRQSDGSSR